MHIDTHHHFWRLARGDYDWLTPDLAVLYRDFGPADLQPLTHAARVTKTIVVQAAPTLSETRYLLEYARNEISIAGVVGWVPLLDPDAPAMLAELALEPKFKGVRAMLQDLPDDDWILDPALGPAVQALIDHGLRFDALVHPRHLRQLGEFAERHRRLPIVINHGGKPPIDQGAAGWQPWAERISKLAKLPHVFCKLSGLATQASPGWRDGTLAPYVTHLVEQFGARRLMWGSDWPVLNLNGDYSTWFACAQRLTAALNADERAAIFGGTGRNFYGV